MIKIIICPSVVCYCLCVCLLVAQAGLKAGLSSSEVKELSGLAKSQPIKDKLKQTTQEAINYKASILPFILFYLTSFQCLTLSLLSLRPQAFGFPLIVCHVDGKPQVFFGSDRFELMANCIGKYVFFLYSGLFFFCKIYSKHNCCVLSFRREVARSTT